MGKEDEGETGAARGQQKPPPPPPPRPTTQKPCPEPRALPNSLVLQSFAPGSTFLPHPREISIHGETPAPRVRVRPLGEHVEYR